MSAAISQILGAREYRFDVVDAAANARCRADWSSRIGGRDESTGGKCVPNFNLSRWNNEAWLNINCPDLVGDQREILSDGRLTLDLGSRVHRFYPVGDNHIEWEIEFPARPASNVIEFNLKFSDNLRFPYQPALTQADLDRGRYRPPEVVGSYPVYVAGKRHNRYQTGKIAHIYRPKARDAEGKEVWCDLNIDAPSGKMTVTIPADWLNAAAYPVILDPYYGFTSEPMTEEANTGLLCGTGDYTAAFPGNYTVTALHAYHRVSAGPRNWQGCVYQCDTETHGYPIPGNLLGSSAVHACSHTSKTLSSVAINLALSAGEYYYPCIASQRASGGSVHYTYYDSAVDYHWCGYYPDPELVFEDWFEDGAGVWSSWDSAYGVYLEYSTSTIHEVSLTISGAGDAAPSAKSIIPVALALKGGGQCSPSGVLEFSRSVSFQAVGAVSCAAGMIISRILDITAGANVAASASAVLAPGLTIAGAGQVQPYWGLRRRFSLPPRSAVLGERAIDPVTGDYSLAAGGDFAVDDGCGNEAYKRIFQVLYEPPLEPNVGRVHRERLKDLTRVRRQLSEDCEKALAPMIEAGRVKSVTVQEVQPATPRTGWLYLLVTVIEAGGRRRTFDYWIPVI